MMTSGLLPVKVDRYVGVGTLCLTTSMREPSLYLSLLG